MFDYDLGCEPLIFKNTTIRIIRYLFEEIQLATLEIHLCHRQLKINLFWGYVD